jgi:hypothetical protein
MTTLGKRLALDPQLRGNLIGVAQLLGCSPTEAANAMACVLQHYADDDAAMDVLVNSDLAWVGVSEDDLRRGREIMEDSDNQKASRQEYRQAHRVRSPREVELEARLAAAEQELSRLHLHAMSTFTAAAEPVQQSFAGDLLREIGTRAAHGAKQEMSAQAKQAIIAGVRQMVPSIPKGPAYDAGLAIVVPLLLLTLGRVAQEYGELDANGFTGKLLAGVTEGAGLAMEGTSKEAVRAVVDGAAPVLLQLAAVTRPELAAGGYDDE